MKNTFFCSKISNWDGTWGSKRAKKHCFLTFLSLFWPLVAWAFLKKNINFLIFYKKTKNHEKESTQEKSAKKHKKTHFFHFGTLFQGFATKQPFLQILYTGRPKVTQKRGPKLAKCWKSDFLKKNTVFLMFFLAFFWKSVTRLTKIDPKVTLLLSLFWRKNTLFWWYAGTNTLFWSFCLEEKNPFFSETQPKTAFFRHFFSSKKSLLETWLYYGKTQKSHFF